MAYPVIDVSDKFAVSATAYGTSRYEFNPGGQTASGLQIFELREISISCDSNFVSTGKLQVFLGGRALTNGAGNTAEISPAGTFTIRFDGEDFVTLDRGEKLTVDLRVTSGSGVAQIITTGRYLNKREYDALRKRHGLEE